MSYSLSSEILSRYEQAQVIMQGCKANSFIRNDTVLPYWIDNSSCFWYKKETRKGKEFRIVNAIYATNELAFDHLKFALELGKATNQRINFENLPIEDVIITISPLTIRFKYAGKSWLCDAELSICDEGKATDPIEGELSPDGKKIVFIRDYNLWIKDIFSGDEKPLTQDGTRYNSYGSSFLSMNMRAQVMWAPDSASLLTIQLDTRKVRERPHITYVPSGKSFNPKLHLLKAAYPGDKYVESNRLISIDILTGKSKLALYHELPYVQHGVTFDGFFSAGLGWWSVDNRHAFFVDLTRGSKTARIVKWDTRTGETRVLFEENIETYIRLTEDIFSHRIFFPLTDTNELVWYSESSGWAHLYLYDLDTGELKHPITQGKWLIRGILHCDPTKRELLIQTASRGVNNNPYYRDICVVNIDSGDLRELKSDNHDHIVYYPDYYSVALSGSLNLERSEDISGVSPCGQYVVTTYSRVDTPPVSILINRNSGKIFEFEIVDITDLPVDWHWPEPIMLKAADGKTDIYGVVFRPPGFSPDHQYPVIDFLVGLRALSVAPIGSFDNQYICTYYDMAALAALGFIVVGILGRGTPQRDKIFQDHNFGKPGQDDDLEDHLAGLRQLAEIYPYMDMTRVGLTSMEGAENVIYGALKYSNFYKVIVSHCFTDPRFSFSSFEMYSGITDETIRSSAPGPEDSVDSINSKLLLTHGVLTVGAEPFFRLVESLQNANKNFDMLCLPCLAIQISSYTRRRGWDYFVTHLQNTQPPPEFKLVTSEDILVEKSGYNIVEENNNTMDEHVSKKVEENC